MSQTLQGMHAICAASEGGTASTEAFEVGHTCKHKHEIIDKGLAKLKPCCAASRTLDSLPCEVRCSTMHTVADGAQLDTMHDNAILQHSADLPEAQVLKNICKS